MASGRTLLEDFVILHVHHELPVPRSALSAVALGFQLLKLIEEAPTQRLVELSIFVASHQALKLHKESRSGELLRA